MSPETEPSTAERILDAAERCVLAVGFTRTTLTDIAKTAGLSRMTVYRHWASSGEILQELMTREFNAVIGEGIDGLSGDTEITRELIVDAGVDALEALSEHPLFLRILASDPDLLLPYVTERPGRFQQHAAGLLAAAIGRSGDVRDDSPQRLAESTLLALRGYALTDKSGWSRVRRRRVLDDLRRMLDGLLAPEGRR